MLTTATNLVGFGFPVLRGKDGYFTPRRDYAMAWSDLVQVLLTPIGSRAFNRAFGSSLHLSLFEPNDADQQALIAYSVRTAAAKWTPYINVLDIRVSKESKTIKIAITFSLATDSQQDTGLISVAASTFSTLVAA